jgi:hypothetical protein
MLYCFYHLLTFYQHFTIINTHYDADIGNSKLHLLKLKREAEESSRAVKYQKNPRRRLNPLKNKAVDPSHRCLFIDQIICGIRDRRETSSDGSAR